jgi:quinol monooxygenase YgiN
MVTLGLLVKLEVKPGKQAEVETRLKHAFEVVQKEPGTTAWVAVRTGPTSYVVFDVFPDEESRTAHLATGRRGLGEVSDLFSEPPIVLSTEVVAAKLP